MIIFLLSCRNEKFTDTNANDIGNNVATEVFEVSLDSMLEHLSAFSQIAEDNSNNRALGTSGAEETQQYIKTAMTEMGYRVWTEPFELAFFRTLEEPIVQLAEQEFSASTFVYSASGDVTADFVPVDVQIPPGPNANSSTSGCESSDFDGFPIGAIALLQRGTCTFASKVENAIAAGASAVVIFNEGQANRTSIVEGMLEETGSTIPVVGVSFRTGETLVESARNELRVFVSAETTMVETENIFAEIENPVSEDFVLVGAHMDSVTAGPGINDNGSGSAMLLSIAEWLIESPQPQEHSIRFAWWSAEELGLLGSQEYVNSTTDLANVLYYLNFDMVASPNFVRFVYDGDGSQFGIEGPEGSASIERAFEEHFNKEGLAFTGTPFDGRSDYGPFIQAGIPSGGLFTGAEMVMTEAQAAEYNGQAGVAFDGCYHQACDNNENINAQVLQEMANAALDVTIFLSQDQFQRARRNASVIQFDNQGEYLIR